MQIEVVGFLGIFIVVLVFLAESTKRRIFGVVAALLLIVLSVWILTDGIQIVTGTLKSQVFI